LSLRLELAKLTADRMFTDNELQTVGVATVNQREVTQLSTGGRCIL